MNERAPNLPYEQAISPTSNELAEALKEMGAPDGAIEIVRELPPEQAGIYVDNFIKAAKTADSEFKAPDWWEHLHKENA